MVERIPKAGQIIYINFSPSASSEIVKQRPAVVVSNNILMKTSDFVWVAPISHGTYNGVDYPLHVKLDSRTKIDGNVYVEQLKSFDYQARNWEFVEDLPSDIFDEIRKKAVLVLK
ncbi:MAG: type II toxin-antitoxin system PemK/MazF family toxin [Levilactobacillus sp.]|jgi:mRNA interferase MazF|uniref:Type II toxin-antitoxin system PemK/MazF family toxin n=1 Tax=Levilactobacillus suantsaiihabitans TaxID=2487722 RepID=A0A4Z0J9V2_9LACO|nr:MULTISPECIES: type II toxin-antitoxin system PemK/MazF family toxin [Levilactobacillus]MCH4123349.1 type II toxin-antitoxin system PemK/MazF family toxin [Levilactobacillus sp.]MCI1552513.1 type II toxin-antitoxin system PemK/MazF family toxin [Levilactobacillus sp.]TGD18991.1 type II toxin-antitoxin system PemK/MazF family toxin [Levilactobacillus suantsaiihabitans]